ncbi:alpha/beta fold hydrolase, partial [Legionella sp. CNM-1927-20]|uniref:alpha/beta fold hydrolase n=1 Tax=Legionella sp. CNM-1927-20 TaxID=3422221 RepID=UPI00403B1300
GYSLGGMIALMVAARYPEFVQQLIMLDSPLTLKTLTPIIESQKEFGQRLLHYRQTNQIEQLYAEIHNDSSSIGMSLCDPSIIEITINQHEKMIEGFDIEQLIPLIKCPFF